MSINESGKYVCVLTTEDDQKVRKDLFIYLRPVFHTNGSLRLKIEDEKHPFQITASSTKVLRGETAILRCPTIGYPTPSIIWYKGENKKLLELESSKRYEFRGNELIIQNVEDTDEEIYRCVAWNNFSISVNGTSSNERFTATLDQKLWNLYLG
uniref:Ig-like domain-containing protein n=1 Tax=Acrobeloides nanus TaxID=290746 RepID=A0A914CJQ2_9BILA